MLCPKTRKTGKRCEGHNLLETISVFNKNVLKSKLCITFRFVVVFVGVGVVGVIYCCYSFVSKAVYVLYFHKLFVIS